MLCLIAYLSKTSMPLYFVLMVPLYYTPSITHSSNILYALCSILCYKVPNEAVRCKINNLLFLLRSPNISFFSLFGYSLQLVVFSCCFRTNNTTCEVKIYCEFPSYINASTDSVIRQTNLYIIPWCHPSMPMEFFQGSFCSVIFIFFLSAKLGDIQRRMCMFFMISNFYIAQVK